MARQALRNIDLTDADIDRIERVVQTEVPQSIARRDPGLYRDMVGAVVDTMTNRLATGRYGSSVKAVANQRGQFSAINGPRDQGYRVYGSVDKAPKGNTITRDAVAAHLGSRALGKPSKIGGSLDYANPNFSSAKSMRDWIGPMMDAGAQKLGLGTDVHYHGLAPNNAPRPSQDYGLSLPAGYAPETVGPFDPRQRSYPANLAYTPTLPDAGPVPAGRSTALAGIPRTATPNIPQRFGPAPRETTMLTALTGAPRKTGAEAAIEAALTGGPMRPAAPAPRPGMVTPITGRPVADQGGRVARDLPAGFDAGRFGVAAPAPRPGMTINPRVPIAPLPTSRAVALASAPRMSAPAERQAVANAPIPTSRPALAADRPSFPAARPGMVTPTAAQAIADRGGRVAPASFSERWGEPAVTRTAASRSPVTLGNFFGVTPASAEERAPTRPAAPVSRPSVSAGVRDTVSRPSLPDYIGRPFNQAASRMSQDPRLVGEPNAPPRLARPIDVSAIPTSWASPNLSTRPAVSAPYTGPRMSIDPALVGPAPLKNGMIGSPELAGQMPRPTIAAPLPAPPAPRTVPTRVVAAPVPVRAPVAAPRRVAALAPVPVAPPRRVVTPVARPIGSIGELPDYTGSIAGMERRAYNPADTLLGRVPGSVPVHDAWGGLRETTVPQQSLFSQVLGGRAGLTGTLIGGAVAGPVGALAGNLIGRNLIGSSLGGLGGGHVYNGSTAGMQRRSSVSPGSVNLGRVDDRRNQGGGGRSSGGGSKSSSGGGGRSVGRNSADSSRGFGANGFSGNK